MARLEWSKSIDFQASQMLEGSTAQLQADGSVQGDPIVPSEALYEVATLRAGDYGFRVKLGGGEAVLKVADRTYELFQPEVQPRWVDLDRVPLSPGPHRMSLMLAGGAQATSLGIIPPCMLLRWSRRVDGSRSSLCASTRWRSRSRGPSISSRTCQKSATPSPSEEKTSLEL